MILRAMAFGFFLWLIVAGVLRFTGELFFLRANEMQIFIAAPVLAVVSAVVFLKLLREAHGDEGEAAIGLAMPMLFLNAFLAYNFNAAFPNIDLTRAAVLGASAFGAWTLLFCGSILFTGLSMSKLASQDERV